MTKQVALLRGINVGGKNILPMKELAAMFVASGCGDVATYIQSGNVVFSAGAGVAKGLAGLISQRIEERFGLRIPVVMRTDEELGAVIRENPYLKGGVPEELLHVYFLADVPGAAEVGKLDPLRSAPDAFSVRGREVYLHLPNGMARTKLTNAYFDSKLGTVSTARNWRTVLKLYEMMSA
ncbi:MAG TPA: DUF1697 domain-containing protein [Edaphobacter sp.]